MTFDDKGILSVDAPGLYGTLSSKMAPAEMERIERAYFQVSKLGGLSEEPVMRKEGASFNPRPARFCHILWKECHERRAFVLIAAILTCLAPTELNKISDDFEEERSAAFSVLSYDVNKSYDPIIERIFLVKTLDELRHLHMTSLPIRKRHAVYTSILNELIPHIRHSENERLKVVLVDIIDKLGRIIREDCS